MVRNVDARSGAEVPQVDLGAPSRPPPGVNFAVKQLVGFARIVLKPGQAMRVKLRIDRRDLSYTILVGTSSRDIRLRGGIEVRH